MLTGSDQTRLQLATHDFADGVAGELVDDDDLPGHLVVCEVLPDMLFEHLRCGRRPGRQYHESGEPLPELFVGDTDSGYLRNRRVGGERVFRLFDFDRAISLKSGLRPAVCGCSGIVSGVPSCLDSGIRIRPA